MPTSRMSTTATTSPASATSAAGATSSAESNKLSAGAAAGIGVGGALFVVGIIALIFFLFRRARKRKQSLKQPPSNFNASSHHPSLAPTSPPPQFSSPYDHPQEVKMGYHDPPPMALAPNYGQERSLSHELDTAGMTASPPLSAYHSQSASMTPRRLPSPTSNGIIAPQPRSPAPVLTNNAYQQNQQSRGQVSPPIGGHRTPVSHHESGSYGFPSNEASPNPEMEGFQFQQQQQNALGSPDSQQRLFPRRAVAPSDPRASQ